MHLHSCCVVGVCTLHRADGKQARGHMSQTALKTPVETHSECTYVHSPKILVSDYPTCPNMKMLNAEYCVRNNSGILLHM